MDELFCIKIHMKQRNMDCLFDPSSKSNLISMHLVERLGMEIQYHIHPYPLGWVRKDVELKVRKKWKFKFVVNQKIVDELVVDVVPMGICGVNLVCPYFYVSDAIFKKRENQYRLFKYGKSYAINAHNEINSHKEKTKLYRIDAYKERRIIDNTNKFVLLFPREGN